MSCNNIMAKEREGGSTCSNVFLFSSCNPFPSFFISANSVPHIYFADLLWFFPAASTSEKKSVVEIPSRFLFPRRVTKAKPPTLLSSFFLPCPMPPTDHRPETRPADFCYGIRHKKPSQFIEIEKATKVRGFAFNFFRPYLRSTWQKHRLSFYYSMNRGINFFGNCLSNPRPPNTETNLCRCAITAFRSAFAENCARTQARQSNRRKGGMPSCFDRGLIKMHCQEWATSGFFLTMMGEKRSRNL